MGPQIPVSPSPLPQTPHTAKPRLGWGDAQARGGARSRGPPWGPPWGRVDTNDLHTAALRRRPAAGGPRLWGSVLQGSQRTEVSNACPNQPLPRHAPGHAAAATLPSRPPQSLSWGRTSEAASLNGWEGGPFPQSGALRRVVGCSPWLGDVGCRWFGGLMQKAGEGLCNPMDCSPPGSSVHEILQARILEWVANPSPGDLSKPGTEAKSLALHERLPEILIVPREETHTAAAARGNT